MFDIKPPRWRIDKLMVVETSRSDVIKYCRVERLLWLNHKDSGKAQSPPAQFRYGARVSSVDESSEIFAEFRDDDVGPIAHLGQLESDQTTQQPMKRIINTEPGTQVKKLSFSIFWENLTWYFTLHRLWSNLGVWSVEFLPLLACKRIAQAPMCLQRVSKWTFPQLVCIQAEFQADAPTCCTGSEQHRQQWTGNWSEPSPARIGPSY